MKKIVIIIFICFSVNTLMAQEVLKDKIIANVYAILMEAANDFKNYSGDVLTTEKNGDNTFKLIRPIFIKNNYFSSKIHYWKTSDYYSLALESDDEGGESIYRTVESALDKLVEQNVLTKSETRFPAGVQTKAIGYYDSRKYPVASLWFKSTIPVLRYSIVFSSNKNIQNQLKEYLSIAKINIPVTQPNVTPLKKPAKTIEKYVDLISFNEYFLFYQNLINNSDLGFDWIFNTKNPDSLEIKFVYIYPNSPFTKAVDFKINNNIVTIVKIDGVPTAKITQQEAINLLNGKPGTNCEIVLRIKKNGIDLLIPKTITRSTYTNLAKSNYEKGIAAFKKAKIDEAIKYFNDYTYPPSQIILFKIYSGRILDEISFTNKEDAAVYNKLHNLINIDSIKKYSQNQADNAALTALLSLYCNEYQFNTPGLTNAKSILTKKAADDGDVLAQEIMAYTHAWHFKEDEEFISRDILPDKLQAMYWYKRALAGGSKEGEKMWAAIRKMKTSENVYGVDLGRSRVFNFKDAKAVTKVAHLKHGLMGIIPDYISPFGVNGFEEGVVYTDDKSHLPFTWSTHIIQNKDFAIKNYEDALYVFKHEFSNGDIKDVNWLYSPKQDGAILKSNAAVFTVIENDGKSYKMRMMLYLLEADGGYQIGLQYSQ